MTCSSYLQGAVDSNAVGKDSNWEAFLAGALGPYQVFSLRLALVACDQCSQESCGNKQIGAIFPTLRFWIR